MLVVLHIEWGAPMVKWLDIFIPSVIEKLGLLGPLNYYFGGRKATWSFRSAFNKIMIKLKRMI